VCPRLDKVLERAAGFNGSTCEEMVGSWRAGAYQWPTTFEEMKALARTHGLLYKEKHGRWPANSSGRCDTLDGSPTWGAIDSILRIRSGRVAGLPLAFGNLPMKDRSEENAREVRAFFDAHKRWPLRSAVGEERRLATAYGELRKCHPHLCAKYRLAPTLARKITWPQTREAFEALALEHGALFKKRHGAWPTHDSGVCSTIENTPKWCAIDKALRKFGSCLPVVFGELPMRERSEANAQAAREWFEAKGRWPRKRTRCADESKLGRALSTIRKNRPDLCTKYNLSL